MTTVLRGLVRRWHIISGAVLAASMGSLVFGPLFLAYIADVALAFLLACLLGLLALSITRQICHARQAVRRPDYSAIARMERDVWGEAFEHAGAPVPLPPSILLERRVDRATAEKVLGPVPPGMTMAEFTEGTGRLAQFCRTHAQQMPRRTTCASGHRANPDGTCLRCEVERLRKLTATMKHDQLRDLPDHNGRNSDGRIRVPQGLRWRGARQRGGFASGPGWAIRWA